MPNQQSTINIPKPISRMTSNQPITCLAHLAKNIILTGHEDGTLTMWNIATGCCIRSFQHANSHSPVNCITYFLDKYVVSGNANGGLFVWDAHTGICECVFFKHDNEKINNVVHVANTNTIRSCSENIICTWDFLIGKLVDKASYLQVGGHPAKFLTLLDNGDAVIKRVERHDPGVLARFLASKSPDVIQDQYYQLLSTWNVDQPGEFHCFSEMYISNDAQCTVKQHNNQLLMINHYDDVNNTNGKMLEVINMTKKNQNIQLTVPSENWFDLSNDDLDNNFTSMALFVGHKLIASSINGSLHTWSLDTGKHISTTKVHDSSEIIRDMLYVPGGLVTSTGKSLFLWPSTVLNPQINQRSTTSWWYDSSVLLVNSFFNNFNWGNSNTVKKHEKQPGEVHVETNDDTLLRWKKSG